MWELVLLRALIRKKINFLFEGPEFLRKPESFWPNKFVETDLSEVLISACLLKSVKKEEILFWNL